MDRESVTIMSKQNTTYLTNTGIDFEQFKPPIRVEKDKPIPSRLKDAEIQELLDTGLIRESEGASDE